jgi:DNA-directed RNA polymerase subunit alpha
MDPISLPTNISIKPSEDNKFEGKLVIEPLYPGYGPTVANALRRVLLSSLPGAAIFAFKIKGVSHEFTSVDYVKEDVVDISLNLKRVNLKSHTDDPVQLTLKGDGEKILTAGDIEKNSDIEVANPDQVIMTLTDKAASVDITLWVKVGRGYDTVESREDEELEINAISIDSIFTPVHQVGYDVDNVRIGDRTDYDKVIMNIETNGSITIEDAIKQASSILSDHFKLLSEFDEIQPEEEEQAEKSEENSETEEVEEKEEKENAEKEDKSEKPK